MIKAVFFDWYNTLACYKPTNEELQLAACEAFGLNLSPKVLWRAIPAADKYYYEENTRAPVEARSPDEKAKVYYCYEEIILEAAGVKVTKELALGILMKVRELAKGATFSLFDDTLPTLKILKARGLILGMISNLPEDKLPICKELGLTEYLDFIITPREAGADKPDSAIFFTALKKAGVEAFDSIHVGDQYYFDIVGARNAGIKALFLDRYDLFPEVKDCPRLRNLNQVVDYLEKQQYRKQPHLKPLSLKLHELL